MRGYPEWNFPAFKEAEERIRALGHTVFSPAAVDQALHIGPKTHTGYDPIHLRHVIQMDMACIYAADAIALLPGWEDSAGVTVEVAMAQFLGLPIYDAMTVDEITIFTRPWRLINAPHNP